MFYSCNINQQFLSTFMWITYNHIYGSKFLFSSRTKIIFITCFYLKYQRSWLYQITVTVHNHTNNFIFALRAKDIHQQTIFALQAKDIQPQIIFALQAKDIHQQFIFALQAKDIPQQFIFALHTKYIHQQFIFALHAKYINISKKYIIISEFI